jgi:hypothetical protein
MPLANIRWERKFASEHGMQLLQQARGKLGYTSNLPTQIPSHQIILD